jgi:hypothetical protein
MTEPKKDYFKLPFEVFYSEYIPITQNEFKSDIDLENFSDIKVVHQEQGLCWGTRFGCSKNTGPELYCCIINGHDEAQPSWLEVLEEDSADFNSGDNFAVEIKENKVRFRDFTEDELDEESEAYLDVDSMDYFGGDSVFAYHLDQSSPDYIVLDAEDSRIKVNLDGFVLDEEGMPTAERIFDPQKLNDEELSEYSSRDLYDLRYEWITNTFANNFPNEKPLKYSEG